MQRKQDEILKRDHTKTNGMMSTLGSSTDADAEEHAAKMAATAVPLQEHDEDDMDVMPSEVTSEIMVDPLHKDHPMEQHDTTIIYGTPNQQQNDGTATLSGSNSVYSTQSSAVALPFDEAHPASDFPTNASTLDTEFMTVSGIDDTVVMTITPIDDYMDDDDMDGHVHEWDEGNHHES